MPRPNGSDAAPAPELPLGRELRCLRFAFRLAFPPLREFPLQRKLRREPVWIHAAALLPSPLALAAWALVPLPPKLAARALSLLAPVLLRVFSPILSVPPEPQPEQPARFSPPPLVGMLRAPMP